MATFTKLIMSIVLMSSIITFLLTPICKKIATKIKILDHPCNRKKHHSPMPKLGGLAIFIAFLTTTYLFIPISLQIKGILVGAFLIVGLGMIDDIYTSSPWIKLVSQVLIATFVTMQFNISIHWVTNPLGGVFSLDILAVPLTVLWIVGITNALNLLDGVDGLAAGTSAISAIILSIVAIQTAQLPAALLLLALFGSCIGFLKYNFPPAQIYLGDTGSMLIGFILSTVSIIGVLKSTFTLSLLIPLIALGLPITDTLFSIIRRLKNKQPIFQADNGHLHHILLNKGLSPKQVTLSSYILTAMLGVIAIVIA